MRWCVLRRDLSRSPERAAPFSEIEGPREEPRPSSCPRDLTDEPIYVAWLLVVFLARGNVVSPSFWLGNAKRELAGFLGNRVLSCTGLVVDGAWLAVYRWSSLVRDNRGGCVSHRVISRRKGNTVFFAVPRESPAVNPGELPQRNLAMKI